MTIDRETLIAICERAFTPQDKWNNRDSARAHQQLGEAYALLRAGCAFQIIRKDATLRPNSQTIWVRIAFHGFGYFEGGYGDDDPEEYCRREIYYLPSSKRLDEVNGEDWY